MAAGGQHLGRSPGSGEGGAGPVLEHAVLDADLFELVRSKISAKSRSTRSLPA